ncbi:MAG: glycine zipper 2TM domain-containing protein [Alphaproteobacteria bacterium]|nr:glycine zipper 2TM domain-containing protein [Alphaproteobacteria bacterium]
MKIKIIASAALLSLTLAACAQPGNPHGGGINKEMGGTAIGAIGGGILGSNIGKGKGNIAAIIGGTLLGGMLGNQIGASLDRADMAYYNQTSQRALERAPSNQTVTWVNPDSGNSGTITPTRTFQQGSAYCREYQQTIQVGGQTKQGYGTACRQPDGTWQVVN